MFTHPSRIVSACALAVGLNLLAVGGLHADPSDCTEWAVGGQTGDLYRLTGQSEVTETQTLSLEGGTCGLSAGGETTYSVTYNVGHYVNQQTQAQVDVNCSTGEVIR